MKVYGYSGRLKILFWLKRPIFIVKRPYLEYFFQYLQNGRNCIFIKEDLSDLIEKIQYLEKNPDIYIQITKETSEFANRYLTKDFALNYLKNIIQKNEHFY